MARYRGRLSKSSSPLHPLVGVSIAALLVFAVLALDVPMRIAALGSGNLDRLVAPKTTVAFGDTAELAGRGSRPPLRVTAQSAVPVRPLARDVRVSRGQRLVGVELSVRNVGDLPWESAPDTTIVAVDARGASHAPELRVRKLREGRVLPSAVRLEPGVTIRRVVVFSLPRSTPVTKVSLTVGAGLTRTVEWVDHQND